VGQPGISHSETLAPRLFPTPLLTVPSVLCPQNPLRWTAYLARQLDRYGLALLIGYRLAGAAIILSIYYLLEWGVPIQDLEHYASYFGYNAKSKFVGKASEYAGALVCSAVLFPVTLMMAPFLARVLHRLTSAVWRSKGKVPPVPTSS
jgi:hypothetical protein